MTLLARLPGLPLPTGGAPGAQGPPPDLSLREQPGSPHTAPAGFSPIPDIVTPACHVPAPRLYAAIQAVAAAQPPVWPAAVWPAAVWPDRLPAGPVARCTPFNFPDRVTAKASPADAVKLVLYSGSMYGYGRSRRQPTEDGSLPCRPGPDAPSSRPYQPSQRKMMPACMDSARS
jgi:hypothetical protein